MTKVESELISQSNYLKICQPTNFIDLQYRTLDIAQLHVNALRICVSRKTETPSKIKKNEKKSSIKQFCNKKVFEKSIGILN